MGVAQQQKKGGGDGEAGEVRDGNENEVVKLIRVNVNTTWKFVALDSAESSVTE